jgi:phenylacetic acid degradation operon negative regulatory protein
MSLKLNKGRLSLKDKILLSIVLGVDKKNLVPFNGLSFPFAPQISMDCLSEWVNAGRSVFYSTVSRMNKESYIVVENSLVKITDKGKTYLVENFAHLFSKNIKWDGNWRIIVFDIKEAERYKRDKLRNNLIKIKFAPISAGVWATAFNIFPEIASGCIYIEGKLQRPVIDKILLYYKIIEINNEYGRLCMALKKAKHLQEHDTIPSLRSQFLEVYSSDPQLPRELLPKEWLGEKAKRLFTNV